MKQDTIIWIGLTVIFLLSIALAEATGGNGSRMRSRDCCAICSGRAE